MIFKFCEDEIQWCVTRRQNETTARKWGRKATKTGHGQLCWKLPSELPPDASPWHPPPLAVPAGLSLCGRHVWSWLAGVLAWRSHLSIIDFPLFHSSCFLSLLSFYFPASPTSPLFFSSSSSLGHHFSHFLNVYFFFLFIFLLYLLPPPFPFHPYLGLSLIIFLTSFLTSVLFVPISYHLQPPPLTLSPFFCIHHISPVYKKFTSP